MSQNSSLFYKPEDREPEIQKKRWNIWRIIGKILRRTCMVLGAWVLFSAVFSLVMLSTFLKNSGPAPLPEDMLLYLALTEGISEKQEDAGFGELLPSPSITLKNVTDALAAAKNDDRIKAFVLNFKAGGITMAQVEELRTALDDFRESGKKAYIFSASYAETGAGLGGYYFAQGFDEIWMQPVGMISVAGFSAEIPYARGVLDKVGIAPQFLQREDYKNAMEMFTNSEPTPESIETYETILGRFETAILDGLNTERMSAERFTEISEKYGIVSDQKALELGLIDRLDYGDMLLENLRAEHMGDPKDESLKLVSIGRYLGAKDGAFPDSETAGSSLALGFLDQEDESKSAENSDEKNIALIYVTGTIMPMAANSGSAAAEDLVPAILKAARSDTIDTIILRVDSPGGSPSASESIRRALQVAKEEGKTVIVSMANVAASGGYWIAADADRIFANASTMTGSIGVVMGKFSAAELLKTVGINMSYVDTGDVSSIWSLSRPFNDAQLARMEDLIDRTYDQFLTLVSEGREMSKADVRQIAGGRVWIGTDALEVGLVDQIGGLSDALDFAARELGAEDRFDVAVEILPRPKTPVEQVLELLGQRAQISAAAQTNAKILNALSPLVQKVEAAQNPYNTMILNPELDLLR